MMKFLRSISNKKTQSKNEIDAPSPDQARSQNQQQTVEKKSNVLNTSEEHTINYDNMIVVHYSENFRNVSNKDELLFSYFENLHPNSVDEIDKEKSKINDKTAFIYYINDGIAERIIKDKKINKGVYSFEIQPHRNQKKGENQIQKKKNQHFIENENIVIDGNNVEKPPQKYKNQHLIENEYIVIDGNSVAVKHGNDQTFSCQGIKLAVEFFKKQNTENQNIKVIVPEYRKNPNHPKHPGRQLEILDELKNDGILSFTPSEVYDDYFILKYGQSKKATVISLDKYRDLKQKSESLHDYVNKYIIDDVFLVDDQPLDPIDSCKSRSNQVKIDPRKREQSRDKKRSQSNLREIKKQMENRYLFIYFKIFPSELKNTFDVSLKFECKEYNNTIHDYICISGNQLNLCHEYLIAINNNYRYKSIGTNGKPFINKLLDIYKKKLIDENHSYMKSIGSDNYKDKLIIDLNIMNDETILFASMGNEERINKIFTDITHLKWLNEPIKLNTNHSNKINLDELQAEFKDEVYFAFKSHNIQIYSLSTFSRNFNNAIKKINLMKKSTVNSVQIENSLLFDYFNSRKNNLFVSKLKEKLNKPVNFQFQKINKNNDNNHNHSNQDSYASSNNLSSNSNFESDGRRSNSEIDVLGIKKLNFKIYINTESVKDANMCKNYFTELDRNFKTGKKVEIKKKTNIYIENMLQTRIKEFLEIENEDVDLNNLIILDLNKETYSNDFIIYGTVLNREKMDKIIKPFMENLNIHFETIDVNRKSLTKLKEERLELEKEFSIKLFISYKDCKIEMAAFDKDELNNALQKITNLEKQNSVKIWLKKENNLVLERFKKEYSQDFIQKYKVFDIQLNQNYVSIKLKYVKDHRTFEEAEKEIRTCLDNIENEIKWRSLPLKEYLFNYMKNPKIRKTIQNECDVVIKETPNILEPHILLKKGPIKLFICLGNIVNANTSKIVSSVNPVMKHGAGVSKTISDSAGTAYQQECEKLSKPLNIDNIYETTSGEIRCGNIMNIICPVYSPDMDYRKELKKKYEACIHSLETDDLSIAFPLLGCGNYNWPIESSLSSLLEIFSELNLPHRNEKNPLEIYLVEIDKQKFNIAKSFIEKNFKSGENLEIYNFVSREEANHLAKNNDKDINLDKKWYFTDDQYQWKQYRNEILKVINEHYSKNQFEFSLKIDTKNYIFNLSKYTQTNCETQHSRKISDKVPLALDSIWQWKEDGDKWQPYSTNHNHMIEKASREKKPSINLEIKRHVDDKDCNYLIDFTKMQQVNLKTNYIRQIDKKTISIPQKIEIDTGKIDRMNDDDHTKLKKFFQNKLTIIGIKENINEAIKKINQTLENLEYQDSISGKDISDLSTKLEFLSFTKNDKRWYKNDVEILQRKDNIEFKGKTKAQVNSVKDEIKDLFFQKTTISYPKFWDTELEYDPGKNHIEVKVSINSPEWNIVKDKFHSSMDEKSFTITGVVRIQNKSIYKYYHQEIHYLKNKNDFENEKLLWHGTKQNEPIKLYNGDKCGMDNRFCRNGMWGTGIYFAEKAAYSNSNFSHQLITGEKQIFLAKVLIGDEISLKADSTLINAPMKDPNEDIKGRYDSVKGYTGNSDVYIIYENQKAYPNYLVTYISN